jgi:hypothetical protein
MMRPSTQTWENPTLPIISEQAIPPLPQIPFPEHHEATASPSVTLDAHTAVYDAVRDSQRAISAKRLKVSVRLLARNHYLSGDRERICSVVRNLLGSAIASSPVGAQLTVRSTRPAECALRIEIEERSPWLRPQTPAKPATRRRNARD